MLMTSLKFAVLAAGAALALAPAVSFAANQGQGQAVVTVMAKSNREADPRIQAQDLDVKINGRISAATGWTALSGSESPLELVVLIDGSARSSIGTQNSEIESLIRQLPTGSKSALAYMQNGRAAFAGALSSDSAQVLKGLRLPGGSPGENGSPYFCLSDLAKHWPSSDRSARREVVMITDGIDNYSPRFDPEDPYVQSAIKDSVRAGLVVYAIYWADTGRMDNALNLSSGGQNLLQMVADATGGVNYWNGIGNPVSFQPYFKDLLERFDHQYRLSFSAELKGQAEVSSMKFNIAGPAAQITAPHKVFVEPAAQ
jgi:hypothetical protein